MSCFGVASYATQIRGNAMNMGMQQQPGMQLRPRSLAASEGYDLYIRICTFTRTLDVAEAKHDDDSKHGRLLSCARAPEIARNRTLLTPFRKRSYAGHAAAEFYGGKIGKWLQVFLSGTTQT